MTQDNAASFPFQDLPPELQLQIWSYLVPEQLVVTIRSPRYSGPSEEVFDPNIHIIRRPTASYHIPALLHICRDSRSFGSRIYRPCFERQLGHPIWFNLSKDLLLMVDGKAFASFMATTRHSEIVADYSDLQQVRNLAIYGHWREYFHNSELRLTHFKALETVFVESQPLFIHRFSQKVWWRQQGRKLAWGASPPRLEIVDPT
jgi:hypothetical protein